MQKIILFILLVFCTAANAQMGTAVRELPFDFHPGDLIQVRIQVTPPPGTTTWTVHEMYPNDWELVSSTNASSTNGFTGEILFGPFTNDMAQTLSYSIASIMEMTNSANFCGEVSFNGETNVVVGTTNLPARNEWLFDGPQSLARGQISGVAYGSGRWIASSFGWVTTLESGGRLTYPRAQGLYGDGFSRLAYIGGLFLLFGASPNHPALMSVSDDGISWKWAESEPGDVHSDPFVGVGEIRSVIYGNGVYVAVGYHLYPEESQIQGAIFRSTDGYHWKRVLRLGSPSREINAVSFAEGRFMAVAAQGTLLTSTNGLNWTQIQPIAGDYSWTNQSLNGVCYGPAGWIIPTSLAGTALRSFDGETWTEIDGTSPGDGAGKFWQSFYADGKYWFSDYSAGYTTENGTSWTPNWNPSAVRPTGPVSRAPDGVNPQYLGAGTGFGNLVSSTNGIDWDTAVIGGSVEWPRYLSVARSLSGEIIVTGQGSAYSHADIGPTDRPPKVWIPNVLENVLTIRDSNGHWRRSVAGYTQTAYADLLPTTNGVLAAGSKRNKEFRADVLVGTNQSILNSTLLPVLTRVVPVQYYRLEGPNYVGWESVNASFATTPNGYDLFAESYSYLGPGNGDPEIVWGHFTSTDGMNWSRRNFGLNNVTNFPGIRGLAWGAGRFVAVGKGTSPGISGPLISSNRIYTSADGENYVAVDLSRLSPGLEGEGLTGVAYANEKFVAVGNAGRILSSTNGLDWETVRNSDGHHWNRVRYLEGTWAAVGNAGWVGFSSDGQVWTSKTSGTESDLTDIAKQGTRYVMVGSHAMVLVSLPTASPIILTNSIGRDEDGSIYFTVQTEPNILPLIEVSDDLFHWTEKTLSHSPINADGKVTFTDYDTNVKMGHFFRARLP